MDKMRKEFEEWAISCDMCTYFDDVEYRHQSTEWAWKSWKASRSALCVGLPEVRVLDGGVIAEIGFEMAIRDFEKALDESGVSYK